MAESYDRNSSCSISDDMIKEALKSGLSSIKASDDLINITLEKCQTEITRDKKIKPKSFMRMAYKFGTPLAAEALILVLILMMPAFIILRNHPVQIRRHQLLQLHMIPVMLSAFQKLHQRLRHQHRIITMKSQLLQVMVHVTIVLKRNLQKMEMKSEDCLGLKSAPAMKNNS